MVSFIVLTSRIIIEKHLLGKSYLISNTKELVQQNGTLSMVQIEQSFLLQ